MDQELRAEQGQVQEERSQMAHSAMAKCPVRYVWMKKWVRYALEHWIVAERGYLGHFLHGGTHIGRWDPIAHV